MQNATDTNWKSDPKMPTTDTFDAHIRLADLRTRVNSGERITADEMREVLLQLRAGRDAAGTTRRREAARTRKASKAPPNLNDLFNSQTDFITPDTDFINSQSE
jgi:hypothetical protein